MFAALVLDNAHLIVTKPITVVFSEIEQGIVDQKLFDIAVPKGEDQTAGPATVRFSLREAGPVTLTLSDATGRITTAWSGHREAGDQTLDLDFSDRPQGLYLWRLEAPEGVRAGRVVVAR